MTARMVRTTTTRTFFPTRQIASNHRAGMTEATRTEIVRAVVVLIKPWNWNHLYHKGPCELVDTLALAVSRDLLYTTEKIQLAKKGTEDMMVTVFMSTPRPERANMGSMQHVPVHRKMVMDYKVRYVLSKIVAEV